jgi:histone acetyltransferase (RNA polymerase elongator complex component)
MTVSGAVSEASAEALMRVMRAVAPRDHSILDWEPARWMDDILHRLAVEMVKTATVIATRGVMAPRDSPHERCPTGRAVPCRAMPCRDFPLSHAVRES